MAEGKKLDRSAKRSAFHMYNEPEMQEHYEKLFSLRKVAPGKSLSRALLDEVPILKEVFSYQGWEYFLEINDRVFPGMVTAFYSHLEDRGNATLRTTIREFTMDIGPKELAAITRTQAEGANCLAQERWPDSLGVTEEEVSKELTDSIRYKPSDIITANLSARARKVFSVVQFTILPRLGSTDVLIGLDCMLLYCLMAKRKVNLSYLIAEYMLSAITKDKRRTAAVPYGMLLTKLFQHFKYPLGEEWFEYMEATAFTSHSFKATKKSASGAVITSSKKSSKFLPSDKEERAPKKGKVPEAKKSPIRRSERGLKGTEESKRKKKLILPSESEESEEEEEMITQELRTKIREEKRRKFASEPSEKGKRPDKLPIKSRLVELKYGSLPKGTPRAPLILRELMDAEAAGHEIDYAEYSEEEEEEVDVMAESKMLQEQRKLEETKKLQAAKGMASSKGSTRVQVSEPFVVIHEEPSQPMSQQFGYTSFPVSEPEPAQPSEASPAQKPSSSDTSPPETEADTVMNQILISVCESMDKDAEIEGEFGDLNMEDFSHELEPIIEEPEECSPALEMVLTAKPHPSIRIEPMEEEEVVSDSVPAADDSQKVPQLSTPPAEPACSHQSGDTVPLPSPLIHTSPAPGPTIHLPHSEPADTSIPATSPSTIESRIVLQNLRELQARQDRTEAAIRDLHAQMRTHEDLLLQILHAVKHR